MTLLALLLLAASGRVELVDQVFDIPRAEWRYLDEVSLKQTPVTVDCDFETIGHGSVRIALLSRTDLNRLRAEQPHQWLAATGPETRGHLRYEVRAPGDYAIVVDNRKGSPVKVHLRLALDFSGKEVRYLSPGRQLAVIVISFAVFFGIVLFSARRLLRAMRG